MTAALARPGPGTGPGPDVEIRLQTNDRLAAPAAMTAHPPVSRWRIVAPAGLTPVIEGDLTIGLPGANVELAGCYLAGNLIVGAELAALTLTGVTMNPAAGTTLSVETGAWTLRLSASLCHLGPVRADLSAFPVTLADCIVDGAGVTLSPCGAEPAPPTPVPAVVGGGPVPAPAPRDGPSRSPDLSRWTPYRPRTACSASGIHTVVTSAGCLRYSHLGDQDDPAAHPPAHQCLSGPLPTMMSSGAESVGYYAPLLAAPAERGADPGAHRRFGRWRNGRLPPRPARAAGAATGPAAGRDDTAQGASAPDTFPPGGIT